MLDGVDVLPNNGAMPQLSENGSAFGGIMPPTGDDVTRRMEADILGGRWASGAKLPGERSLATEYRVGRSVVREALRRMEERGLVVVAPARGAFVQLLEPTSGLGSLDVLTRGGLITARHLIVSRRSIESQAAALAAVHHTDADALRMRRLLSALEATSEADVATAARLDVAFHESISVASANPVLQIMFGSIRDLTHGLVVRSLTDRLVRELGLPLHADILAAILARDEQGAEQAMRSHLEIAATHYGADLDRPLADVATERANQLPRFSQQIAELEAMSPTAEWNSTAAKENRG